MTIYAPPAGQAAPLDRAWLERIAAILIREEMKHRRVTLPTYEFSKGETVH